MKALLVICVLLTVSLSASAAEITAPPPTGSSDSPPAVHCDPGYFLNEENDSCENEFGELEELIAAAENPTGGLRSASR